MAAINGAVSSLRLGETAFSVRLPGSVRSRFRSSRVGRSHLVEHQVDDYARDRNIKPERESPPGDRDVPRIFSSQTTPECEYGQRWNERS